MNIWRLIWSPILRFFTSFWEPFIGILKCRNIVSIITAIRDRGFYFLDISTVNQVFYGNVFLAPVRHYRRNAIIPFKISFYAVLTIITANRRRFDLGSLRCFYLGGAG